MVSQADGSCLCGGVQIRVSGEPMEVRLCYCTDCRKVSGSTNSLNWCVELSKVSIQSSASVSLSSVVVKGDSGAVMTGYFCSGCGTTVTRQSSAISGLVFVKAGIFGDDVIDAHTPQVEAFLKHRPKWICALAGADQKREG